MTSNLTWSLTTDPSLKTLKPGEVFETGLVLTAFRAAGCGTVRHRFELIATQQSQIRVLF